MDTAQDGDKEADGMLRALIQRLSDQIDTMDKSVSHAQLTSVAEQLEASLIQVQRLQERLRASLSRSLEHEQAAKRKAVAMRDISEGFRALGRLETKVDAVSAKIGEHLNTCKAHKIDLNRRIAALQETLAETRDHGNAETAKKSAQESAEATTASTQLHITTGRPAPRTASSNSADVNTPNTVNDATRASNALVRTGPAPSPVHAARKRKRRRRQGKSELSVPNAADLLPSDDHRRKISELAAMPRLDCQIANEVLSCLLPCPDGGLWDANRIHDCVRSLSTGESGTKKVTWLGRRMLLLWDRSHDGWFCAVHAPADRSDPVDPDGRCGSCLPRTWCVQLRRAALTGLLRRYCYARVCATEHGK
ncbi:hypothetical protein MYCTH_97164 [Thermothelomyces thermophilus ATCC 42464]|uniref:Uncharacterized protein n=1 Tax=Thermothelomyces thermophilus (strain ATCC 42464 / BCRC 31852 / DSM 1799) TaxID=573729 RepID=G2QKX7_THET4|nr:uncharacterized protein MYCTH_97164 [Thermothelomyces thermophilus ATCC 42464]AEO60609.1 hypothetical protein MYCTH_97164 [Thermothelomyces thermophilus ATCC 42464]